VVTRASKAAKRAGYKLEKYLSRPDSTAETPVEKTKSAAPEEKTVKAEVTVQES
jgi:hypothetical protein